MILSFFERFLETAEAAQLTFSYYFYYTRYGSEVLAGVQQDSDQVWNEQVANPETATVGHDWYKATIQIHAHSTRPWTAQAVRPDGTLGTEFAFQR